MQTLKEIDFNNVDELTPGYHLTRDNEKRLLILEPSWFYLSKKSMDSPFPKRFRRWAVWIGIKPKPSS
jgi:hypothetical protein